MPFVDRDDLSLAFDDIGEGRCVVMTHSFLCSREMWGYQATELAESYRVVNIDLRGHGASGPADDAFRLSDLVYDVVTVLDHLGIESAIWCGLSVGGMLSLRAALTMPDRVDGLIVADSGGGRDPWSVGAKYRLMATASRVVGLSRMMPAVAPIMFGKTTLVEQPDLVGEWGSRMAGMHLASLFSMLDALIGRRDILGDLDEIRVPSLILVGAEDKAQPPARSRQLAAAIPGAELVVIPEAGHLSALEQPEAVSEVMLDFLRQNFPTEGVG